MAVKLPQREFLTFPELQERWACTENDIRRLILSARLIPSYLWNLSLGVFTLSEVTDDGPPYWLPTEVPNDVEFGNENDRAEFPFKRASAEGFYFLMFPWQTSALNCNFIHLSKDRNLKQQTGQTYLLLKGSKSYFTLDDVIESGVVMMSEVALFEGNAQAGEEKPLSTTERNSLLRLVIGMAIKGYAYAPSALKSSAPKEISDDLAQLDINISSDTVRSYLKEAEKTVLPKKTPGKA